jgi:hypothetical protein
MRQQYDVAEQSGDVIAIDGATKSYRRVPRRPSPTSPCGFDVPWRRGDLLLIDNMLTAHGRRPCTGDRRVLVAMS